ncbi:MAG: DUF4374 domain-containing protein [Dysgonamonadaceae bacterium]|jgi:hypothetical protein|nr:DUF4374 domain-containing protein [Dysgonamonadaceae bacterium]
MITNFNRSLSARLLTLMGCACVLFLFVACDETLPKSGPEKPGAFFLAATGESSQYILTTDRPETGSLSIADNFRQLELSGYTWIFNSNPSVAVGLIYQQGDPGVGLGYTVNEDGSLYESGQFLITSRFTSYGFFDRYALTSVGGVTPVDGQGNALTDAAGHPRTDGVTFNFFDLKNNFASQNKTIPTLNLTGNGEQATFSGIVDLGNGEFLTGLVVSQPRDPNAGGGASSGVITYPDSVWVAAFDAGLNLKRIYRDDRISYSSGRFRSQYYSQIAQAGDGSVYVFSGSYESATTRPAGALRINRGAAAFDASYYFNIQEKTGGYKFRKVWHITGNYFLLELYNDLVPTATGAATQYGVVDVAAQTFRWVTGIPAKDRITATGLPASYGGKMYFPITAEAADPAIYLIDPATATASKGLTVTGAAAINAIGRLTQD